MPLILLSVFVCTNLFTVPVITQDVIRWLLTAKICFQPQVTPSDITRRRCDTEARFTPELLFSPANHHSNTATYSSITSPRGV